MFFSSFLSFIFFCPPSLFSFFYDTQLLQHHQEVWNLVGFFSFFFFFLFSAFSPFFFGFSPKAPLPGSDGIRKIVSFPFFL